MSVKILNALKIKNNILVFVIEKNKIEEKKAKEKEKEKEINLDLSKMKRQNVK